MIMIRAVCQLTGAVSEVPIHADEHDFFEACKRLNEGHSFDEAFSLLPRTEREKLREIFEPNRLQEDQQG